MRKISFIVLTGLLLSCLVSKNSLAASVEITPNETEHTVVMPYEKSFLFKANIKNNGTAVATVQCQAKSESIPQTWHVLAPTGQFKLDAGEQVDFIAVFEPGSGGPGQGEQTKEEIVSVPIICSGDTSKTMTVTVKTKIMSAEQAEEKSLVTVKVVDKNNKSISKATVLALLPSGMESFQAQSSGSDYNFSFPSIDYISNLVKQYKINHTNNGYYLQVYATGYKSYFESNFQPKNSDTKTVKLENLDKIGDYKLSKTIESGYSIWWPKSSTDGKYIAFSQGAHDDPSRTSPSSTKVILTDSSGNKVWEKTTGGECWGLDITSDASYVAAGCHDSYLYVWDKNGKVVWKKSMGMPATGGNNPQDQGTRVRWVKFSPDGKYLLSGPANNKPEESGLYETSNGNLKWSYYTGDWLREGRFSSDGKTVYFSSSNGTVYALNAEDGSKKWLGLGEHVIPFMLGISEQANMVVSAGKGRAFTAMDLTNGKSKWQTVVDQTITAAQIAIDGSIVGATVGGMVYKIDKDGKIIWTRKYGGVGHNGVFYTKNGKYALLGGPNATLLDENGNIIWEKEKNKTIQMSSVQEINTGGANVVWMNEDATLLILGGDDGIISFYTGSIKNGKNEYKQAGGMNNGMDNQSDSGPSGDQTQRSPWPFAIGGGFIILTIITIVILKNEIKY